MAGIYYPAKDAEFSIWLAEFLTVKARRGTETSAPSNIAFINGGGVVPPVV